jgi:hypothetical protein
MSIEIGRTDKFERRYVQKFRYLIENFGEFIRYECDRAAVDLGLHLTEPSTRVVTAETVSTIKVWFQLKGIQATTFSQTSFNNSTDIKLSLPVEQIKFWYASPEAIYIAVYVECADVFIAEDIRDIVDTTIFNCCSDAIRLLLLFAPIKSPALLLRVSIILLPSP